MRLCHYRTGIILLILGVWGSTAEVTPPSAQAILSAYAKANDRIQGFAAHYTEEFRKEATLTQTTMPSGRFTLFNEGWCFHDFAKRRTMIRRKTWGMVGVNAVPLAKEKASYMQLRWADGVEHQYTPESTTNCIAQGPEQMRRFVANPCIILGYFPGVEAIGYYNGDYRRLDKKMADANLSVRKDKERVGESECYVVESMNRFGRITAWFDPQKDFALIQYTVELDSRNIERENLTVAQAFKCDGVSKRVEVTIEKFTRVKDLWLPITIKEHEYASLPKGNYHDSTRIIQLDSWSINPDFEALHAFELKDIPDDSVWQYVGPSRERYRWDGGKLTPISQAKTR